MSEVMNDTMQSVFVQEEDSIQPELIGRSLKI